MNEQSRESFLKGVQEYVEHDPEVAALVQSHVQKGIHEALRQSRERAADMEVALTIALTHRYKDKDSIIKQKIAKWADKSALCWDWVLKK